MIGQFVDPVLYTIIKSLAHFESSNSTRKVKGQNFMCERENWDPEPIFENSKFKIFPKTSSDRRQVLK